MEPIAVIGYAMRLPQGRNDSDSLWKTLCEGRNLSTEWPTSRVRLESFYDADTRKHNALRSKGGHFIAEDPAVFDAPFFSITANEAAAIDPQQRLMLETSYLSLENAGIPMYQAAGSRTSVFVATMSDDYRSMFWKDPDDMPQNAATGTAAAMLANRISWFYNLLGPSMHVDTACSGSLVALDLACNSLRNGDSSMALVAGANLMLSPGFSLLMTPMNFLSPDSVCHSFDSRANGYARGEGSIVMVLKKLADAINDGDTIRTVIRSTGTNQDGRTPGLTQPSAESQERLIRDVYQKAGLDFGLTRYVEAHGTGTPIGDPLEIKAIGRVFGKFHSPLEPLYVGSIKSNIGHLESGSGLAGVLKSILMLEKGMIVPNALFEETNPALDADLYNIKIANKLIPWPISGPRRVSVNSFGFGGSNAHVVLDDAYHYLRANNIVGNHCTHPGIPGGTDGNGITTRSFRPQLLVLSATDEATLKRMIDQYAPYYHQNISGNQLHLERLAYTLCMKRSRMLWKAFAVLDPVRSYFGAETEMPVSKPFRSSQTGLAFVFTGQGAEYLKMGMELLEYSVFRDTLRRFNDALTVLGCEWSLLESMGEPETIGRPQYSQPICTALQIALVELLRSLNITPNVVVGHSSGEIAAAYTAGMLSLESACKVSYYRGLLAESLSKTSPVTGAMMSVNLTSEDASNYLRKRINGVDMNSTVTIACINSPGNVTLSGKEQDIDLLKVKLDENDVFAHKLRTGVAYHSPAMNAMAKQYILLMGELTSNASGPKIPMISTVTGTVVAPKLVSNAQYWVSNLVSPVQFADAMNLVLEKESNTMSTFGLERIYDIIEIGPHGALRRPVKDIVSHGPRSSEIRYMAVLDRNESAILSFLKLAGNLYTYGYPVSIHKANRFGKEEEEEEEESSKSLSALTDLPAYPFDHSRRYWHESRLSYDYRMRESVPRDVLGSRVQDWNPLEPRWRKMIDAVELPWVHDHVVSGNSIFPATGMLLMAVEAVKQSVADSEAVRGFCIKTAEFKSPIALPSGANGQSKIEVITSLHSFRPAEKESGWFEVWISTQCNRAWKECFRCTIQVQYNQNDIPLGGDREHQLTEKAAMKIYNDASEACTRAVPSRAFYRYTKDSGITYGPSFSILENIRCHNASTAVATVDTTQPILNYEGLVHPAILDAAFQVCWVVPTRGLTEKSPTEIPHRLHDTYISALGWDNTNSIRIASAASKKGIGKGVEGEIVVLGDDGTLLWQVGRLELSPVASDGFGSDINRKLLHGIRWAPCLSMLTPSDTLEVCKANDYSGDEQAAIQYNKELTRALCLSIQEALLEITEEDVERAPMHLKKYVSWMKKIVADRDADMIDHDTPKHTLSTTLNDVVALKPEWEVFIAVARNLVDIIHGDVDPLQLIFTSNLAERFYADMFRSICDTRLTTYLDLVSHENPGLSILEVGAGTGGFTGHILTALEALEERDGGTKFSQYMYTDISPGFFDNARSKFERFGHRMEFKVLDLERTVTSQGFKEGAYDIIIAGSVLHTTKSLETTLQHLRKALKPGGKLLFFEITGPNSLHLQVGYGVLPGWWYGTEAWRQGDQDQVTSEEQWDELLAQNGFSGNDVVLRDHPSNVCHSWSIIASTAINEAVNHDPAPRVVICYDGMQEKQRRVALAIRQSFTISEVKFEVTSLDQLMPATIDPEDVVICLYEVGTSLLSDLSELSFAAIQTLMRTARSMLWISALGTVGENSASSHLATGFMRTMRNEAINSKIVTVAFEGLFDAPQTFAKQIMSVFQKTFIENSAEVEFIMRDNRFMVGRLTEENAINRDIMSGAYPALISEAWDIGPQTKLEVGVPGVLDSLRFTEDTVPRDLGPNDVEIAARAWGLGYRDLSIALGRPGEIDFGMDTAGVVRRVGCGVSSFTPGDRVVTVKCGSLRGYPRAHELEVLKIPDSVSFEDAASFAAPAIMAYHCLISTARLSKDEKVLIHLAAGATGQLAVQVAQMVGAEVYATVSTAEKKELLISLGVSEKHIFYSRDASFAQGVRRMTGGSGVDVVLNSLSGDGLRASWECIAPFGRFVEIGKVDIEANSSLHMAYFKKNPSFSAVDLGHLFSVRKQTLQDYLCETFKLLLEGHLRYPEPRHVHSVTDIEDSFRLLHSGRVAGRIVINSSPSDVVTKYIKKRHDWVFREDASYLIAGGLGGIGRGISRWMMRKGVKNLILPSRSGPNTPASQALLSELHLNGVNTLAPICDVSCTEVLKSMLREVAVTMPPIKGCINACMMLQDSIFDTMTHSQWSTSLTSKISTSLNLHHNLPQNLDFFILLSSLSGIYGNISQANYAAGNTFQDALARYRRSHLGEKALAIDLGLMKRIGIIAERQDSQKVQIEGVDMVSIEEEELMALLDVYCDPNTTWDPSMSQILVGAITPAYCQDSGMSVPESMKVPLFSGFWDTGSASHLTASTGNNGDVDVAAMFRQAETDIQRTDVVVQALSAKLARSLGVEMGDLDTAKALCEYGVDSLVAVELRNWIGREFGGVEVTVFEIMSESATVVEIGELVVRKKKGV